MKPAQIALLISEGIYHHMFDHCDVCVYLLGLCMFEMTVKVIFLKVIKHCKLF